MEYETVFCCREPMSCLNYRSECRVYFKQLVLGEGERLEHKGLNDICVLFVLSGRICVFEQEKRQVCVEAGEMVVLSSLAKQEVVCEQEAEIVWFMADYLKDFSAKLIRSLEDDCNKTNYRCNKLPIRKVLSSFLELLICYLKNGMDCGYLLEEKREELFILLDAYYTRSELALFLYPYVVIKDSDFKKMVLLNSLKAKGVPELIELCGYTSGGFKKMFKEVFGGSIYQWMLQQKAEKLRYRLAEDDVNLKALIGEFGFSSPAHFTKFCKKWLGKTPTQYMEEVKSKRGQINI